MLGRKTNKAQSAMEYLMTYGWAILIIAVVLGALFSLGIFSNPGIGTACIASPGYLCTGPALNSNGELSFQFGVNTGTTIYDIEFACAATANTLGLPDNGYAWSPISPTGAADVMTGNVGTGSGMTTGFVSGQTLAITGLPCYGPTGLPLGSQLNPAPATGTATIGTSYSGSLYMNYTASLCTSSCTWYTLKIATLSLKVV